MPADLAHVGSQGCEHADNLSSTNRSLPYEENAVRRKAERQTPPFSERDRRTYPQPWQRDDDF
jgi:hypothetical protein